MAPRFLGAPNGDLPMKPRIFSKLPLPLIAAVLTAASASAQDKKGTNLSDSVAIPAAPTPAEQLVLGYRLADYARTTKDARAMIVAARMVDSITVKEGTDRGKLEGAGKGGGEARPISAAGLFAEAKQFANGDADILAEIEKAQAESSRSAMRGAIRTVQFVPAQTTWTVNLAWRGGEPMVIGMRRDTATPVDLKIYDENGNLVCQDMSHNVTLYCRVNPIWSGAFSIQGINHGDVGTGIAMVTN
jgi:hypothetical protein